MLPFAQKNKHILWSMHEQKLLASQFLLKAIVLDWHFAGRMKYLVLVVLSALMAVYLQRSEDPLLPVGVLVETMRSYCGSALGKLHSFVGVCLLSRCKLWFCKQWFIELVSFTPTSELFLCSCNFDSGSVRTTAQQLVITYFFLVGKHKTHPQRTS